jgi:GntR family phosphonate transport system transcriptional regulator
VASALGLAEGKPVHRLLRRGLADGVPVSIGHLWHDAARFTDLAARRAAGESVAEIGRSRGITDDFRKRTGIFARRPTPEEAALPNRGWSRGGAGSKPPRSTA